MVKTRPFPKIINDLGPVNIVVGWTAIICAALVGVLGLYVLNIIWRVSFAENDLFGRSYLLPLTLHPRQYDQPPSPSSYGSGTYEFNRGGKTVIVYKQLVNGFQHAYGSALVAFEIGAPAADLLFRANEYVEAYCCKDGRTLKHFLDTKKDLHNNAVGREIGFAARDRHISNKDAETFMVGQVCEDMEKGVVLDHFLSPRVVALPSPDNYGCPGLPKPTARGEGAY